MNGKKAKALRKLASQYSKEFRPAGLSSQQKLIKTAPNPRYVPGVQNGEPKVFAVTHPGTLRNNTGSARRVYQLIKKQHTAHHTNPDAGVSKFYVSCTIVTTRGLLRYFRHFN